MTETQSYTPTTWADEIPATTPPTYDIEGVATDVEIALHAAGTAGTAVNATNLNKMEAGILAASPATGTWTPTFDGFSVAPSNVVASYVRIGVLCICTVKMDAGTSNATGFTITLPYDAAAVTNQAWRAPAIVEDSGTVQSTPGLVEVTAGNGAASIVKTFDPASTFTASGAKGADFTLVYQCDPTS